MSRAEVSKRLHAVQCVADRDQAPSLTDTELREYHSEKIVRRKFSGYFAQSALRQAQLFSQEIKRLGLGRQVGTRERQMTCHLMQGLNICLLYTSDAADE